MISSKPLILIGAGGHCVSAIDVIESEGKYKIMGILDNDDKKDRLIAGYPVIGNDSLISDLTKKGYEFLITIGQVKSPTLRIRLFQQVKQAGGQLAKIVSPRAHVSSRSQIGEGTLVHHFAMINAASVVGINCIINSSAIIEHDCNVGDHCHISTGVRMNGGVTIAAESFLGSGTIVFQNISIAQPVVIGAGSVVNKDIHVRGTYFGVPACAKMVNA